MGSKLEPLMIKNVRVKDEFWAKRLQQVREVVIPYQWEVLNDRVPAAEPSHAIENFRIAAGRTEGAYYGWVFQDSDVAKWLEAVGYCLIRQADPELERLADSVIDLVVKAQQADGYLNTYFTVKEPGGRWTNLRDNHEMYCAGHMMEAAVAYYEATGKRKFLDAMCWLADHIDAAFGSEPGKKKGYPGHEEIELALVKLYQTTGEQRYLRLSRFFIDERGHEPHYYDLEAKERGDETSGRPYDKAYSQAHLPVREQTNAVGHAVRAMYLYSGMADMAAETNDETLVTACKRLWNNLTKRQMYITGGIGSAVQGEAFTFDYDLPNDTAYTETCAAIGLVFWAHRMLMLDVDHDYADVMERAFYNVVLSGISLGGREYFYVNPLEVWPEAC
ncbi:glycoside hydrolase family 127 protein, partial [Candidatus Bipolaricaulota bacterium]|nr:glycoside hydrolase family 127 protein [Candidatus Bipolaricaulota bacterium]